MSAFNDKDPGNSVDEGHFATPQNRQAQQQNRSHPQNPSYSPHAGTTSSELHSSLPLAARIDMTTPSTGTLARRSLPDNVSELSTSSALDAASAEKGDSAARSHDASDLSRKNDPRSEAVGLEQSGYERKIGRGTSWRRDHNSLSEEDYTVRGRGRGAGPPYRGRGHRYRDDEVRDYRYDRDYDRSPIGYPADSRGPPYGADGRSHEPGYDSRRDYPPHVYNYRRDCPPDVAARYYDDYRRGYDPGDFAPAPAIRPPIDSRRLYDRGPVSGRGADFSDYDRSYSRSRDDYHGDPRGPREVIPRPPLDHRPPRDIRTDSRYIDEERAASRADNPRMLPPPIEGRPRDFREYPQQAENRRLLRDENYSRAPPRGADINEKSEPPESKISEDLFTSARDGLRKEFVDPGRDPLRKGPRGALDPEEGARLAYGYDRERMMPPERYRDASGYGRNPYGNYEGLGRGRGARGDLSYNRSRDSRDFYHDSSNYPPAPVHNRGRNAYPGSSPSAMSYARTTTPEERYPRGPPVNLDPPRGREEGYRDSPSRSFDHVQKRKYDDDYVDEYRDDPKGRDARYAGPYYDYSRPAFDVDERDPKRVRAVDGGRLPPEPREPAFRRPPSVDDPLPPEQEADRPYSANPDRTELPPRPERSRPQGRYFLVKTSTAENLTQSRETNRWGIAVKDVEAFREAFKSGAVTLLFALDETGRFCGYASMTSDVGAVPPMTWMEEHCNPVGAAFEVRHHTTDDVRTTLTTKLRNQLTEGEPIRFGRDGQEISGAEGAGLVDELNEMSGPENAEKRANAVVVRGGGPRGRGRGGRGSSGRGRYHDGPRGRGRGRGRHEY